MLLHCGIVREVRSALAQRDCEKRCAVLLHCGIEREVRSAIALRDYEEEVRSAIALRDCEREVRSAAHCVSISVCFCALN